MGLTFHLTFNFCYYLISLSFSYFNLMRGKTNNQLISLITDLKSKYIIGQVSANQLPVRLLLKIIFLKKDILFGI